MNKTLRTLFVAVFALLLAGTAIAATGSQPTADAEAETVTSAILPAMQAPLLELGNDHREQCGEVLCPPMQVCCNSLEGICVKPGDACIY